MASSHSPLEPSSFTFPQMSAEEIAILTVPFRDVDVRLAQVLAEHGVAVVPDVASPEDCAAFETLFSEDLYSTLELPEAALRTAELAGPESESLARALREVIAAGPENAARVWPSGTPLGRRGAGGASARGLPHGRFAWTARLHPRVRACYRALYGSDDLCVGLDQPFFVPQSTPDASESSRLWPHADVNTHSRGGTEDVFQSVLYVWGSDRDGASTTVVQCGSHKETFNTLMRDPFIASKSGHFSQISSMSDVSTAGALWASFVASGRRVPVPAGGLLVWSSRTMHQGHGGGSRLAMPVCWEPAWRRGEDVRARKARLVLAGLASSHWASLGLQHGAARSRSEALPAVPAPPGSTWVEAQLPLLPLAPLPGIVTDGGEDTASMRALVLANARRDFKDVDADKSLWDKLLGALSPVVRDAL